MMILINLVKYYLINNLLNHNFLTCAKAEIQDLIVCIVVNGEKFQSRCDLDLDQTMPNIELVQAIFIYRPTTICSSFK